MSNKFQDIKIVSFDKEASSKPDPNLALFNCVLNLSTNAPQVWVQIFNLMWQNHFYMMKRKAAASCDRITTYCVPDELQNGLLDELKAVVASTNKKYEEYLDAKKLENQHENDREKNEQTILNDLDKKLKFD